MQKKLFYVKITLNKSRLLNITKTLDVIHIHPRSLTQGFNIFCFTSL